jgi:hypothetical protein
MGFFDDVSDFFFGDDDVTVTPPDPAQQANLDLQNQLLQEQANLSKLLLPVLLGENFDLELGPDGEIRSISPKATTALEENTLQIQNLLAQESLAFLKGEGKIPASVDKAFGESREIFEEGLRKSLGPNFLGSTAGADAIADFETQRINTLEDIRFGRLSTLEGLSLAREGSQRQGEQLDINTLLAGLGVQGSPLGRLQSNQQLTQADQALRLQASISSFDPGFLSGVSQGVGTGLGLFAGNTLFGTSAPTGTG